MESDKAVTKTARALEVNVNTLHTWIAKYHRPKASSKPQKSDEHIYDELKRLRKEITKLKEERAILKKAAAFMPCGSSLPENVTEISIYQ